MPVDTLALKTLPDAGRDIKRTFFDATRAECGCNALIVITIQ